MRLTLLFLLVFVGTGYGQLPGKVLKLDGLWEYKQGSGFEEWQLDGNVMKGTSFRLNKLGDTLITETFEISSINKRLVLELKAFHHVGDSIKEKTRTLIGKKRKMEFTSIEGTKLETLIYKPALFSKKKIYLFISHAGDEKPQKLVLVRRD